jgi:hypothetical protein
MANGKQLILAWQMYAGDQDDRLASNPEWVPGWLDWGLSPAYTNTLYLTGPEALLSPYTAKNVAIYKCPADNFLSGTQRKAGWSKRVRSMSMNFTLGSPGDSLVDYAAKGLTKLSALEQPTLTWVFVDEHPDSQQRLLHRLAQQTVWRTSASSHNGACGFALRGRAFGNQEMARAVHHETGQICYYNNWSAPLSRTEIMRAAERTAKR